MVSTAQARPNDELNFTTSDARVQELLERVREIGDLGAMNALLEWDQNTALPDGAGEVRGAQSATLQGVLHERQTAARLGELLGELEPVVEKAPYTDADRGLVRQTRRQYDHATKLPAGLVQELALVGSSSFEAWRRAREHNDFALFALWLGKTITLQREVADRLSAPSTANRYDALLDLYEPGMTSARLDTLFAAVREVSVSTLQRIQRSGHAVDTSCLEGDFPADTQVALSKELLTGMGYDFDRGAIAVSPHPFTTSFGSPFDVRVTVRPDRRYLQAAVMAAVHEGGHAVYEQGSDPRLARTPVAGGASLGAHESQSRLWENAIGRSEAFWKGQYDKVKAAYPEQYANVDSATFARALNAVRPSLIRVEADEVTYNLHIIARYEMEKSMVNGDVAVESLPGAWNGMYLEYLGIEPPTNSEGILQDIHWTGGFGYFPTYTLGNLYAAQIYATLRAAFANFDERLASSGAGFILDWLRERMYSVGAVYLPEDLIARVTGEKPNPDYFRRYLTEKFAKIYDLAD
jgi:carboxypeptidase Taq